jgi:hypothetical protein
LDHILAAECVRFLREFCVFFGAKNNLGQALAIAEINENHPAMIARDIHPAGERDLPADIGFPQRIAIVCAKHAIPKYRVILSEMKNLASDCGQSGGG